MEKKQFELVHSQRRRETGEKKMENAYIYTIT